jgi:hypothetical protein
MLAGALAPGVILAGVVCWELPGGSLAASRPAPVGAVLVAGVACWLVVASTRPAAGVCPVAHAAPWVVAGQSARVLEVRLLTVSAGCSIVVVGSAAD